MYSSLRRRHGGSRRRGVGGRRRSGSPRRSVGGRRGGSRRRAGSRRRGGSRRRAGSRRRRRSYGGMGLGNAEGANAAALDEGANAAVPDAYQISEDYLHLNQNDERIQEYRAIINAINALVNARVAQLVSYSESIYPADDAQPPIGAMDPFRLRRGYGDTPHGRNLGFRDDRGVIATNLIRGNFAQDDIEQYLEHADDEMADN